MCNLYSQTKTQEAVRRLFKVGHNRMASVEPKDAIFPGHAAPIVRSAEDGERELVTMSWGFVRLEAGKAPRRVTNTRDDTALKSPFWRDSFTKRRCLVPASSFCEPNGEAKPATWHWFAINGDEPRPLFAFAGLWRTWKGPVKKDGPNVDIETYSFMTTTPNALVSTINHERSPVLLTTDEEFETWMRGTPEEAYSLVREYPAERMRIVQGGYDKRDLLDAPSKST